MTDKTKWEMFNDSSYYDMWAVRQVGDNDFNSPRLFHFTMEDDARKFLILLDKCMCVLSGKQP